MLFAEVAATAEEVVSTRARSRKVAALAALLARLSADELPVVVAILTGAPRQGRIGVGYRTVAALDVPPAGEPSLEVLDVDAALSRLAGLSGPGSQGARAALLHRIATFWRDHHLPDHCPCHDNWQNVHWKAPQLENGVRLGKIPNPKK